MTDGVDNCDPGADPSVRWLAHLGGFYDALAVPSLLGPEGQPVIVDAVSEHKDLMALTTGSGKVIYPAFQFRGRQISPGLGRVLAEVPESLSRWTLASWLMSAESDLEGARPIDVLFDQGPAGADAVVDAARAWAAQLQG